MRFLLIVVATITAFACAPATQTPDAGPADAGEGTDAGFVVTSPGCAVPDDARVVAWTADTRLCVSEWSAVGGARGMALSPDGDVFVVSRSRGIVVLHDDDGDGAVTADEQTLFTDSPRPNHGITFHDGFLYASSDTTVWRWTWEPGRRSASGAVEVVVRNMPSGGHITRTLRFDPAGRLLVSIGSAGNTDTGDGTPLPDRALIRRYDVTSIPEGGHEVRAGTVFATGLRNEVGLAYDDRGRLWGVENGRDNLRIDGVFINRDNPAEELHLFPDTDGTFFGYPYCWTEYDWEDGLGRGTQHFDRDMPGGHDDAWCRDPANNHPPTLAMPAHLAPLGLLFVKGAPFSGQHGALVVPTHGSWNRQPATGRTVAVVKLDADGDVTDFETIVGERAPDGSLAEGTWRYRPVDVIHAPDGALLVSDDTAGTVLRIGWTAE